MLKKNGKNKKKVKKNKKKNQNVVKNATCLCFCFVLEKRVVSCQALVVVVVCDHLPLATGSLVPYSLFVNVFVYVCLWAANICVWTANICSQKMNVCVVYVYGLQKFILIFKMLKFQFSDTMS